MKNAFLTFVLFCERFLFSSGNLFCSTKPPKLLVLHKTTFKWWI